MCNHLYLCWTWQYSVISSWNSMCVRMHSSRNCNHKKQDYQYDSNNYLIIIAHIILFNLNVYSDLISSWSIWTWSELFIYYLLLGLWAYARWLWHQLFFDTTKALRDHSLVMAAGDNGNFRIKIVCTLDQGYAPARIWRF